MMVIKTIIKKMGSFASWFLPSGIDQHFISITPRDFSSALSSAPSIKTYHKLERILDEIDEEKQHRGATLEIARFFYTASVPTLVYFYEQYQQMTSVQTHYQDSDYFALGIATYVAGTFLGMFSKWRFHHNNLARILAYNKSADTEEDSLPAAEALHGPPQTKFDLGPYDAASDDALRQQTQKTPKRTHFPPFDWDKFQDDFRKYTS